MTLHDKTHIHPVIARFEPERADYDWEAIEERESFQQMQYFLSTLFCSYEPFGYIMFRYIHPDKTVHTYWFKMEWLTEEAKRLHHFKAIYNSCSRASAEGRDIYVGVLPRDVQDGKARSITRARWFWGDFDSKVRGEQAALDALCEATLMPNMIVYTGGGFHAYWKLDEEANFSGKDGIKHTPARKFVKACRLLANSIMPGTDDVSDLPRILRLPGFPSQKRGGEMVRIISVQKEEWND
jgi:hypothetical protein